MFRSLLLVAVVAAVFLSQTLVHANPVAVPEQERAGRAKKQSTKNNAPVKIGSEITMTHTLKVPPPRSRSSSRCNAVAEISYLQMNDRIRVDTAISSTECAASRGEYRLQVRTRGKSGEAQLRTFTEKWAVTSGTSDKAQKFYAMAGDTELLRARVHRVTCTCDPDEESEE